MNTAPLALITTLDRQRKDIKPKDLLELKRSILSKGLLHAPVLSFTGTTYRLIAGERRLKAMTELHQEGHSFNYDGESVSEGQIPFTTISELTEVEMWELELEENILRQPLSWLEEAEAKAKIHRARVASNPQQSVLQTAREIAARTEKPLYTERIALATSILIDKHKSDPRVLAAKNAKEAHRVILDKAEGFFKAELARRHRVSDSPHKLFHGDCMDVMPNLQPGFFDLIISDPPYGIAADKMKNEAAGHFYDDSEEYALAINQFVLAEGFRLTKPKALIFLFCDIEHFTALRDFASRQAWSPWRTPLIWHKGDEGHAPWGRAGFIRTYECLLFCSKGQKELWKAGGPDVFTIKRPARGDRTHAAEKPVELLERLLSLSCIQGDTILDPCCGSGSIFPAAHRQKVNAYAIEKDKTYHDQATVRLSELYSQEAEREERGNGEVPA